MKILYGSGKYIGSNIAASRFLQNVKGHEVRMAAYYQNHKFLDSFDWCLDAFYQRSFIHNYFKKNHGISGPHIDHNIADMVLTDILDWGPDLVISDCEFFTAMVAKVLEIPLWYCSPMLQLVGLEREGREIKTNIFTNFKLFFDKLPVGDRYFVYSPLCDIQGRPHIKSGFEWVRPYSVKPQVFTSEDIDLGTIQKAIPKNCFITTGETSFVSDCLYSGGFVFISPNTKEVEQSLNAQLTEYYGVGRDIGRSSSLDFMKKLVQKEYHKQPLSIQKWKFLDEKVDENE